MINASADNGYRCVDEDLIGKTGQPVGNHMRCGSRGYFVDNQRSWTLIPMAVGSDLTETPWTVMEHCGGCRSVMCLHAEVMVATTVIVNIKQPFSWDCQ